MEARPRPRGGLTPRPRAWALAACWCAVFAALHLYWATGGAVGLAVSAGTELAATRPLVFVLVGLYGVAAALVAGAATAVLLGTARLRGRRRTFAAVVCVVVGVVLLVRGAGLELALLADVGGLASAVGADQSFWSLVLWDPWFVLGGLAFLATGRGARREAFSDGRRRS